MSGGERFPWREVMALGLGRLRLGSRDFWRMTPRELDAAAAGAFGRAQSPIDRAAVEALMNRYPDEAG